MSRLGLIQNISNTFQESIQTIAGIFDMHYFCVGLNFVCRSHSFLLGWRQAVDEEAEHFRHSVYKFGFRVKNQYAELRRHPFWSHFFKNIFVMPASPYVTLSYECSCFVWLHSCRTTPDNDNMSRRELSIIRGGCIEDGGRHHYTATNENRPYDGFPMVLAQQKNCKKVP